MRTPRNRAAAAGVMTAAGLIAAFALAGCGGTASSSGKAGAGGASKTSGAGQESARHRTPAEFAWFHARATPGGWHSISLPDGNASLSYPGSLHALSGDKGTVSEGLTTKSGTVLVYLNVTPKQGGETLRNWPGFRVGHLLDDDASAAAMTGQATGLAFHGGTGSCVLDAYTTKAGANHYREIACFVQGSHGASVLVAAAPAADWGTYAGLIETAVSAYAVS
jgi:hypothetical protein